MLTGVGPLVPDAEVPVSPLVSVVMPCRDAETTVGPAVRCLLAQTLGDLEVLLIDDGSRDRSVLAAREAADGDPRLRVLPRPREGLVAALNAGLEAARGTFVARMDADDLAPADRLERQVAWADRHPDWWVIGGLVQCFPREEMTEGMRRYEDWLNGVRSPEEVRRDLFVESPLAHPSVIYRRDRVLGIGGYRDGDFPEDYDLWLRVFEAGGPMGKCDALVLQWRDRPDRATRTDPRYGPEAFRRLKAEVLARTFLRGGACQVWGAGPEGRRWRRVLRESGVTVRRFFDIDPRKVGRRLGHGEPVLPIEDLPRWRDCPLLVAVGAPGARDQVRGHLQRLGWVETVDFRCVQ